MGGGGSVETQQIPDRNYRQEQRTLKQGYGFQTNQQNQYVQGQPLLQTAQAGALSNYGGLGGLTAPISALAGQTPSFFGGLQNQVSGLQGQLGGLLPEINRYQQQYTQQGQGLFNQLGGLSSRLGGIYSGQGGPGSIIASGGALTGDLLRAANQQSLSAQEQAGTARTSSGVAQRVLNADQYRAGRLAQAQQVGQQLTQGQEGIAGQQAGVTGLLANLANQFIGQKAGIYGQQAGLTGLSAGLKGQEGALATQLPAAIQGLQTGGLNQLLGAQGANVSSFTGTTNPILGYISNLFAGNQQKDIANAQINAQGQLANQGASAGKQSGTLGAVGSVAGGILAAY